MTLSEWHWKLPDFRQRMTTADWRKILLADEDRIIFRGSCVKLKAENLGCGVVEVHKDIEDD